MIKERLNLHVKRRLQSSETAYESGRDAVRPKIAIPTAVSAKTSAKVKANPISSTKSPKKGQMSKKPMNSSSESINSTVSSTSAPITPSTQSTSSIPKTPSSRRTPTSTTTASVAPSCRSPTTPQPANNNNEGEHEIASDRTVEKHPDILTMVLNEKKLQLMRDPAVLEFLSNIIGLYTAAKLSK